MAAVEGDEDMPNTAADAGEAVADAVRTALATIAPGAIGDVAPMGAVQMNDASDIGAMTWAMIVGEDNVMDVRRLVGGSITSKGDVGYGQHVRRSRRG